MSRRTSAFLHRGGGPGIGFGLVALVLAGGMLASACTSARQAASTKPASSPTKGGSVTYAVALDALPSGIWGTLERNWSWISKIGRAHV